MAFSTQSPHCHWDLQGKSRKSVLQSLFFAIRCIYSESTFRDLSIDEGLHTASILIFAQHGVFYTESPLSLRLARKIENIRLAKFVLPNKKYIFWKYISRPFNWCGSPYCIHFSFCAIWRFLPRVPTVTETCNQNRENPLGEGLFSGIWCVYSESTFRDLSIDVRINTESILVFAQYGVFYTESPLFSTTWRFLHRLPIVTGKSRKSV